MTLVEELRLLAEYLIRPGLPGTSLSGQEQDAAICRRAADLIEKLPQTADGVPVVPGMVLHFHEESHDEWVPEWTVEQAAFDPPDLMWRGTEWSEWWHSFDKAREAAEKGGGV